MAQKEALIVAVDNYKGTKYDLDGVKKDFKKMQQLFENWGFHVTLVRNAESMKLEQYLSHAVNSLSRDDKFIFYYSGHGYHIKDTNGDEPDGEDEALVLSDGERNELFIDDTLFGYINSIKAKKMVLLDSCHSGTAFKAFGNKPRPKSIDQSAVDGIIKTKSFRPQQSKISRGEYIVFSASQDQEESLDTINGGLFTNAFFEQIKRGGAEAKLMNLRQAVENSIISYCMQSDSIPHHPNLSASSSRLKYRTINQFLQLNQSIKPIAIKNIKLIGKSSFNSGELLDFKIDTLGNSGYITIFSIENDSPFIMYQSKALTEGIFNFKNFNIQPPIECYKACRTCASEKSVVYVAFSPTPIGIKLNQATKTIETSSIRDRKAFQHQKVETFKPLIKKFETTIY